MSAVVPMPKTKTQRSVDIITLTPEAAADLLEHNTLNRPLSDGHVKRIANQIREGLWQFNGDTIKIIGDGDIIDGQHRLWACVDANKPIETAIVRGVAREAFSTIDTIRKPRGGADMLALNGVAHYRTIAAAALTWLVRWQNEAIPTYRDPKNKVENRHIEQAYAHHPGITTAVERTKPAVERLVPVSVAAFVYYVVAARDEELADRMLHTLETPGGVSTHDPFFQLRAYLLSEKTRRRRDPVMTIALAFKAANAAKQGKRIDKLSWRTQGPKAEEFPTLNF